MAKNTQKMESTEDTHSVLPPEDTVPQGEDQKTPPTPNDEDDQKKVTSNKEEVPKTVTLKCAYPLVRINGEYIASINGEITVSKQYESEAKKICG